jgi:hypothetical protein
MINSSLKDAIGTELIPVSQAIREVIPGGSNPSCVTRWTTRGLAPAEPEAPRIKLEVLYCGNRAYTTRQAVRDFFERVTAARLARMERTRQRCADTTDAELKAAGLIS